MRDYRGVGLAVLAAFGIGAVGTQTLQAQSRPPAYVIDQIDVTNPDAYMKEFAPLMVKALEAGGGRFLVRGGKTVGFDGEPPPKGRFVVVAFDSLDQAQAVFSTPAYREAKKIGDKYAIFHIAIVEEVAK